MSVKLLPLSIIYVDPTLNVSRGGQPIQESNVKSLVDDLEENGQLEPVGVVSIDDALWLDEKKRASLRGTFEFVLVFGFRRFAAMSLLSKRRRDLEIKAIEQGPLGLAAAELANVAENWSREPPTEFDLTMACARFVRTHKIELDVVARRVNRSAQFVGSCVEIVSRVAPDVLDHYKVNCSRETRRRMVELAAIDAPTKQERHDAQRVRWDQMEAEAAQERRRDPQGGMRRRPPKRSGAIASRSDLRAASERIMIGREVFDGQQWHPINGAIRGALREWVRWALDASSDFPVR